LPFEISTTAILGGGWRCHT